MGHTEQRVAQAIDALQGKLKTLAALEELAGPISTDEIQAYKTQIALEVESAVNAAVLACGAVHRLRVDMHR